MKETKVDTREIHGGERKTARKADENLSSRATEALLGPGAQWARGPSWPPGLNSPWHLPLGCFKARAYQGSPL